MEKNQTLSDSQRKALAKEFKDDYGSMRYQARKKYEETRNSLIQSFLREEAETRGYSKLVAEIESHRHKIQDSESALSKYGLEIDGDGDLSFSSGDPSPLRKTVEKRADKELGTMNEVFAKFDIAALKIWTIATPQDAEELIAELHSVK